MSSITPVLQISPELDLFVRAKDSSWIREIWTRKSTSVCWMMLLVCDLGNETSLHHGFQFWKHFPICYHVGSSQHSWEEGIVNPFFQMKKCKLRKLKPCNQELGNLDCIHGFWILQAFHSTKERSLCVTWRQDRFQGLMDQVVGSLVSVELDGPIRGEGACTGWHGHWLQVLLFWSTGSVLCKGKSFWALNPAFPYC